MPIPLEGYLKVSEYAKLRIAHIDKEIRDLQDERKRMRILAIAYKDSTMLYSEYIATKVEQFQNVKLEDQSNTKRGKK